MSKILHVVLLLAAIALGVASPYAQEWALDPAFGDDGLVLTNIGPASYQSARTFAIQDDGKIVVGGWVFATNDGLMMLSRFHPNGDLDLSFGDNGSVIRSFGGYDAYATGVAIQSDGRIVVSAEDTGRPYSYILRFLPNGQPDLTFGDEGQVEVEIGTYSHFFDVEIGEGGRILAVGSSEVNAVHSLTFLALTPSGSFDTTFGDGGVSRVRVDSFGGTGRDLAVDAQGRYVAAGSAFNGNDVNFALVRVMPNGQPDPSFGINGVSTPTITNDSDTALALDIQNDGQIIVGGYKGDGSSNTNNTDYVVARYNTDGTRDATFGTDGVFVFSNSTWREYLYDVIVLPDQKIAVAGFSLLDSDGISLILARITTGGGLDSSFGDNGVVVFPSVPEGSVAYGVGQPIGGGGELIAIGYLGADVALFQFESDGSLDDSFGDGGIATPGGLGHGNDITRTALLLDDDRILVSAESGRLDGSDCVLVRYDADGHLDGTFGDDGHIVMPFCSGGGNAVVKGADGSLFVAGRYNSELHVAKLFVDGGLDPSFGDNGIALIDDQRVGNVADLVVQPDGKILIASSEAMVRLDPSGKVDSSFGEQGVVDFETYPYDIRATELGLTTSSRIIVGGNRGLDRSSPPWRFTVFQYMPDGSIDLSFGSNGQVQTAFSGASSFLTVLAVYPDGRIMTAGRNESRFAFARFLSDGQLDGTFSNDGRLAMDVTEDTDFLTGLALQPDGKIVAGGYSQDADQFEAFITLRLDDDGERDPTFGDNGVVTTTFGGNTQEASSVLIQQSGRIVAVGRAGLRESTDIALAGYLSVTTPSIEPQIPDPADTELKVYPNPARDVLHIDTSADKIELTDMLGRLISTTENSSGLVEIDVSTLPSGAYIVRADGKSAMITILH